jgi:hypothetical protein
MTPDNTMADTIMVVEKGSVCGGSGPVLIVGCCVDVGVDDASLCIGVGAGTKDAGTVPAYP